jgi:hypothetical protein
MTQNDLSFFDAQTGSLSDGSERLDQDQSTYVNLVSLPEGSEYSPPEAFEFADVPLDLANPAFEEPLNQAPSLFGLNPLYDDSVESYVNEEYAADSLSPNLEHADCLTSEDLLIGKKSRFRPRDDAPAICKPQTETPPTSGIKPSWWPSWMPGGGGDKKPVFNPDDVPESVLESNENEDNTFCVVYTQGVLPLGVCSTGNPSDVKRLTAGLEAVGALFSFERFSVAFPLIRELIKDRFQFSILNVSH